MQVHVKLAICWLIGLLVGVQGRDQQVLVSPNDMNATDLLLNHPHALTHGNFSTNCGATYKELQTLNRQIRPVLERLVKTDFFSYYKLDLFGRDCQFWDDEGMCGNRACSVEVIDNESDLPDVWKPSKLGRLEGHIQKQPSAQDIKDNSYTPFQGGLGNNVEESCVLEDDELSDRDFCLPEDESASGPGVYISLVDNPERFTGYMGPHANMVWQAIYQENCFAGSEESLQNGEGNNDFALLLRSPEQPTSGSKKDLASLMAMREVGPYKKDKLQVSEFLNEDQCLETRTFYRLISGMHTSISVHLCADYLDVETGQWGPNLDCFLKRVGKYPDRISNLYFDYALVARAISKLRFYLYDFTFCDLSRDADVDTRQLTLKLAELADTGEFDVFNEKALFTGPAANLKHEFKSRFMNVSRIMDCVGCDKCRLWGKLQTSGYGTALKILYEYPDAESSGKDIKLRRTELVALVNTFDRLSKSLASIALFEDMFEDRVGHPAPPFPQAVKRELYIALEGVKYILHSWINFPKNIGNIGLYFLLKFWYWFIGI